MAFLRKVLGFREAWKYRGKATLAFEELTPNAEVEKTAMFVHGLLGSGRNWRSFAKRLSDALQEHGCTGWKIVMVNLRNHGQSSGLEFSPPHNISSAARDIADLVTAYPHLQPKILVGHSMGGKVTLEFAKGCAEKAFPEAVAAPKQLWVLDSDVGAVHEKGEVEQVIAVIKTIPNPIPSRRWLVDHMTKLGFSKGLANWLGSNVKEISSSNEECTWVFNVNGAYDMFTSYRNMDYWGLIERPPDDMEIGIVRASKSDRWSPETVRRLEQIVEESKGRVKFHVLENAGHWLHVDNPHGLVQILLPSFQNLS